MTAAPPLSWGRAALTLPFADENAHGNRFLRPDRGAADRYWGAQTERSRNNFRIGDERMPLPLSFARLPWSSSPRRKPIVALGSLDARRAKAIVQAAQEIIDGKLDDQFPLSVWQTGSGTQTNMNVNEVIANRANELLGGKRRREIADSSRTITSI